MVHLWDEFLLIKLSQNIGPNSNCERNDFPWPASSKRGEFYGNYLSVAKWARFHIPRGYFSTSEKSNSYSCTLKDNLLSLTSGDLAAVGRIHPFPHTLKKCIHKARAELDYYTSENYVMMKVSNSAGRFEVPLARSHCLPYVSSEAQALPFWLRLIAFLGLCPPSCGWHPHIGGHYGPGN